MVVVCTYIYIYMGIFFFAAEGLPVLLFWYVKHPRKQLTRASRSFAFRSRLALYNSRVDLIEVEFDAFGTK